VVDELCEPFEICDDLDGRLLVNQAIQGPPLAFELGEVSFGSFTATGAAARPYVDLKVEQHWTPKEACYGPVRSVFSLAPGETVELVVSVDQQTSLVETVTDHLPNVHDPGLFANFGGIAGMASSRPQPTPADAANQANKMARDREREIQMKSKYLSGYGSVWEMLPDPFIHTVIAGVPGAPPSPVDVAKGFVDVVKGALAGDRSPAADAVTTAANAASAAGATSVARHTRDTTTTKTTTTTTHQSLTRSFANPYRDRSLQLRFIPVFRRFEVVTEVKLPEVGVAVQAGGGDVGDRGTSLERAVAADLDTPRAVHVLRPVVRMFSHAEGGGGVPALAWSDASVRGDSVLVPIHDPTSFGHSIGLDEEVQKGLEDTFRGIADLVAGVERERRDVSLFMGTHIEAVAGGCVLHDLPPVEVGPD
jgi:hypothetical protein